MDGNVPCLNFNKISATFPVCFKVTTAGISVAKAYKSEDARILVDNNAHHSKMGVNTPKTTSVRRTR